MGKDDIVNHLSEVSDELAERDAVCTMVIVGGSYLALVDLRESTADVDSLTRLSDEMKSAVRRVADRHGLRPNWLNDSAAMFAPAGLRADDCEVRFQTSHLTVLAPPPDLVFLMKLLAARAPDHDDMVALWPRCAFPDAQAAVDTFYAAYPFEEHDPYLVDYVQQIADQSLKPGAT
ncbi:DUF6036 family nucleotidyltransferase [Kribbella sp. NPDC056951]|uniref:DUF6036 family nucleotidyltransferase n=1 Tax=Kribbella sp. NPDC056951 TaxID=3345978 RepID=UPI00362605DC